MKTFLIASTLVCGLIVFVKANIQSIILYDELHQTGSSIYIKQGYVSNLTKYNFTNKAKSACVNGTWLFYEDFNFNDNETNLMEFFYGNPPNNCFNIKTISGKVSSIKFSGLSSDYLADSITFYTQPYFQGRDEEFLTDSTKNFHIVDKRVKSFIVTGRSNWTIFEENDYGGKATCISPLIVKNNNTSYFVPNTDLVNIPQNKIRSVRKGCV